MHGGKEEKGLYVEDALGARPNGGNEKGRVKEEELGVVVEIETILLRFVVGHGVFALFD